MKNLRRQFDLLCLRNRDKGIPNLMLFICVGNAVVYLLYAVSGVSTLYTLLYFDRSQILCGQVWRLITYPLTMYQLTMYPSNILLMAISLVCYYSLGQAMERQWGCFRFNLFYLCGILLTDIYCMIFGCTASAYYINTSLFISFATLYPEAQFLLFMIIPIKAWLFGLFDLIMVLIGVAASEFPDNLLPLVSLANYFLFFGADVINILPPSLRVKAAQLLRKQPAGSAKIIHFKVSGSQDGSNETAPKNYRHKCTVCGRTDLSDPNMEFRYCSKCNGYYCYCEEHINQHVHIQ